MEREILELRKFVKSGALGSLNDALRVVSATVDRVAALEREATDAVQTLSARCATPAPNDVQPATPAGES